jgi:hypothetical protein
MKIVPRRIQELQTEHFYQADPTYGQGVIEGLGLKIEQIMTGELAAVQKISHFGNELWLRLNRSASWAERSFLAQNRATPAISRFVPRSFGAIMLRDAGQSGFSRRAFR